MAHARRGTERKDDAINEVAAELGTAVCDPIAILPPVHNWQAGKLAARQQATGNSLMACSR